MVRIKLRLLWIIDDQIVRIIQPLVFSLLRVIGSRVNITGKSWRSGAHIVWCPLSWERNLANTIIDGSFEDVNFRSRAADVAPIGAYRAWVGLSRACTSGWTKSSHQLPFSRIPEHNDDPDLCLQRRWPGKNDYVKHQKKLFADLKLHLPEHHPMLGLHL